MMKRIVDLFIVFVFLLYVFGCNNVFNISSVVRIATQDNKDKSGTLLDQWVNNYDSSGKLESVINYDSSYTIQVTSKYSYSSSGKVISSSSYSNSNV